MDYAVYSIKRGVREAVSSALTEAGFSVKPDGIEVFEPRERERGDLSTAACFDAAKALKKSPSEVAEQARAFLKEKKLLPQGAAECEAVNGYLNFSFSEGFLAEALNEALACKDYGRLDAGNGKTVVLDYSCPNVGKPLHIGHIRSTIFGDALKRILERAGYKCVGLNYLGDSGAQVAKLVLALRRYKELPKVEHERDLLAYYVRINKEVEENAELKPEVDKILVAIESGDEGVLKEVQRLRELSVQAFKKTYALLGVDFDVITGESEFISRAKQVAQEALEKGVAARGKTREFAVDLSQYNLEDVVILRSNGTTLYSTRDLALADWKYEKYKFDENIYVAGSEQNLHFKQVFKILELLGREYAKRCRHLGFGLIFLEKKAEERIAKASTRAGEVLLLEDVVNDAVERAKNEINASVAEEEKAGLSKRPRLSGAELNDVAKAVGLAALKFAVLRVGAEKNIVFSPERAVAFQGDTGAYLQYMHVRCSGILAKAGVAEAKPVKLAGAGLNDKERALLVKLAGFPGVVENCASSLAPHALCDYLLRLSGLFSEFYETTPVLKAESEALKAQRLALVLATKKVLGTGLALLGVEALEKM
jgi:arginyl-tRNA synthetase